jgi:hypothetical protein
MFKYVVLEKETKELALESGHKFGANPYSQFICPFKKKPYGVVTLWRGWMDGVYITRLGWAKCNEKDEFDLSEGLIIARAREDRPSNILLDESIPRDVAKVIKKMAAKELGYKR